MFTKNDTRINRNGRPKAEDTKERKRIKEVLTAIYENSLEHLHKHENELSLKDRIELLRIVSPFLLPKLNSVTITPDTELDHFKEINVNIIRGNEGN